MNGIAGDSCYLIKSEIQMVQFVYFGREVRRKIEEDDQKGSSNCCWRFD